MVNAWAPHHFGCSISLKPISAARVAKTEILILFAAESKTKYTLVFVGWFWFLFYFLFGVWGVSLNFDFILFIFFFLKKNVIASCTVCCWGVLCISSLLYDCFVCSICSSEGSLVTCFSEIKVMTRRYKSCVTLTSITIFLLRRGCLSGSCQNNVKELFIQLWPFRYKQNKHWNTCIGCAPKSSKQYATNYQDVPGFIGQFLTESLKPGKRWKDLVPRMFASSAQDLFADGGHFLPESHRLSASTFSRTVERIPHPGQGQGVPPCQPNINHQYDKNNKKITQVCMLLEALA